MPPSARSTTSVEDGDERVEVTVAGGCEERFDDLPLGGQVGVGNGGGATDAATGAAGELARRLGRASDDRRDLLERHGEHVMQDEGEAFSGRERLEHDQQREADGVGEQRPHRGAGRAGRP